MKLNSTVALVTGASSGIGQATAIALSQAGCSVVIHYLRNTAGARETLQACNKYSTGNMIVRANMANEPAMRAMINKVRTKHSALHILINNAGLFDEHDHPTNLQAFDRLYQNNFRGHIAVIKHALRIMHHGKIVNITSVHGRLGYGRPSAAAYAAMKAAFDNYTVNLAKQLAPRILVNAIAPGRVATPMWGRLTPDQEKKLGAVHLTRRMIKPAEIADAVLFLVRNDAMCGEILAVDGGYKLAELN